MDYQKTPEDGDGGADEHAGETRARLPRGGDEADAATGEHDRSVADQHHEYLVYDLSADLVRLRAGYREVWQWADELAGLPWPWLEVETNLVALAPIRRDTRAVKRLR